MDTKICTGRTCKGKKTFSIEQFKVGDKTFKTCQKCRDKGKEYSKKQKENSRKSSNKYNEVHKEELFIKSQTDEFKRKNVIKANKSRRKKNYYKYLEQYNNGTLLERNFKYFQELYFEFVDDFVIPEEKGTHPEYLRLFGNDF